MKKLLSFFTVLLLCAAFLLPVYADDTGIPAERQLPLVVDNAGVLTDAEEAALLEKLTAYSEKAKCEIAFVTVPTLEGKTPQAYADDFYDYNGYGYGDNDDGMLFLMALSERKWHITTYGSAKQELTVDSMQKAVNKHAEPLSAGRYAEAFDGIATELYHLVRPYGAPKWIAIDLVIGFVLAFIIMKVRTANLKSVRQQVNANQYVVPGSLAISQSYEHFLYRNVARTAKPVDTDGGGSGSHTSSSGRSHGGTGGSF